jgi:hypothetical protein
VLIQTAPETRPGWRHERDEPPAPRQQAAYRCVRGHAFEVVFAAEVEPPGSWDCRCGALARHLLADLAAAGPGASVATEPSEHERRMGQLLERRSVAELKQLLADRLAELAAARKIMREGSGGR